MSDVAQAPVFAVVGRVNKGKSSIIATLAEDDRIAISPIPGTTRTCTEFPVQIDGRTLFTLVDTPGFEQAPAALAWLTQDDPASDARVGRVRELVAAHDGTDEFVEERELLKPILAGACILYVVDGTKPYRENYKSEMEILRWTGRPSMALINRIGAGDHAEAWRSALNQYFKVVRDFDAHTASFEERVRLLTTFRELHDPWRSSLQEAIDALDQERTRRRAEVADLVTNLLVAELTFTLETAEGEQGDPKKLEDEFHEVLREKERAARREVEALYNHSRVNWEHESDLERPVFGEDLFAKKTWSVLGLSPTQLLALYTISGALTGGVIDASVGGASFMAGTALGAALGAGAGVFHLQRRFARATSIDGIVGRFKRAFAGGTTYRVGPFAHPNFPFVLLDRALLHYDSVRTRAHARNAIEGDLPTLTGEGRLAASLEKAAREALHKLFEKVRKNYPEVPGDLRQALHDKVAGVLEALDLQPVDPAPDQ